MLSKQAAAYFADVCSKGSADLLRDAAHALDECDDSSSAWRTAMKKVAALQRVHPRIQRAFVPIWVEHKMPALWIGDRSVTAKALRVLMPRGYKGKQLTVFRGALAAECKYRRYGFSWTTDIAVARRFAEHWEKPELNSKGVLLRATVPAKAVLLVRQPEDYFDEGEVVIDPYQLGKVEVLST